MSLTFPALTLVPDDATAPDRDARPCEHDLRSVVREYHGFVWRSVRRLGVPESDVEDASQRVFMVLAKNFEHVAPQKMRSYLFGVAMRVAANERRAARNRSALVRDQAADRIPCSSAPPDEAVDRRRARVLLDEILDTLEEDLRSVYVLHELEHMPMTDIAETIGIPAGTAASRLRRARAQVAQHVARLRAKMSFGGQR